MTIQHPRLTLVTTSPPPVSLVKIRDTKDFPPKLLAACHTMWEALEEIEPQDAREVMQWAGAMYGVPYSMWEEARAAKECRDAALKDLDDHPSPA